MNSPAILKFRRLGIITIFAVYIVILMGGIVRASGAGMGCPDWPTCFGQWIPPTEEAQLPPNYHETYAQRGYENTQFNPINGYYWTPPPGVAPGDEPKIDLSGAFSLSLDSVTGTLNISATVWLREI